jgi:hypothetical protein
MTATVRMLTGWSRWSGEQRSGQRVRGRQPVRGIRLNSIHGGCSEMNTGYRATSLRGPPRWPVDHVTWEAGQEEELGYGKELPRPLPTGYTAPLLVADSVQR